MSHIHSHYFRLRTKSPNAEDATLLQAAHALGFTDVSEIVGETLYVMEGALTEEMRLTLSTMLLQDGIAEVGVWHDESLPPSSDYIVSFVLRAGVSDPLAESVRRMAERLNVPLTQVSTGRRYTVSASRSLSEAEVERLARRLLVNPVIHHCFFGEPQSHHVMASSSVGQIDVIPIRGLSDEALLALSLERRTALNLEEMQVVKSHFEMLQRDPTDVELEMIAQTWSEHCSHKTFRADIHCDDGSTVHGLLKTYIRAATDAINAPWVHSAFVDNAGIIALDDTFDVAFKAETHNHPSAIEPFGGANTGVGGVMRDVLGVSAEPIALTDVLCFGPLDMQLAKIPAGAMHPQRIQLGVVSGIQDYGNKTGVPTVNGAIIYDEGYVANPLVYCGCVGLLPRNSHPRDPQIGDRIIVIGGRTGRDGLRGATFSSMTLDAQTGEVAGASVQIGDPVIARGLIEVIAQARDAKIYTAITDCGAGGLSSAVGEMASTLGADVELSHLPLKYAGLAPWELWLSEAQERMVLAVPATQLFALQKLCDIFEVELTDIGAFTGDGVLCVRYENRPIVQLSTEFLFETRVPFSLEAILPKPIQSPPGQVPTDAETMQAWLLALLSHPNIASKAHIIERYDYQVQGATLIKPLVGAAQDGPSDAAVLKPLTLKSTAAVALSNGINPQFGKLDPLRMAYCVIDEAIRNAVAVGADPDHMAILDNFCWGNPNDPVVLGALVAATQGCYRAAQYYGTPFISGKDSLHNTYLDASGEQRSIPGTLLVSAIGVLPDAQQALTMDFKTAGNVIYLLGDTHIEFGGSHVQLIAPMVDFGAAVPDLPKDAPLLYRALHKAIRRGLVRACHDLSEGGMAVALAEMCMAGRLGCRIVLPKTLPAWVSLFSESNGRLLVEILPENAAAFETLMQGLSCQVIGEVTAQPVLHIEHAPDAHLSWAIDKLQLAWGCSV